VIYGSAALSILIELSHLSAHTQNLFRDGYLREAVRHEAELVLSRIRALAERPELTGHPLVTAAWNERDPILAVNKRSSALQRDEHAGILHAALAVTRGARNVFTHDVESEVDQHEVVMWLAVLDYLNGKLDGAYRVDQTAAEQEQLS